MSDETQDESLPVVDELSVLKERATKMNIKFSPNIGLEALRAKVNEALAPTPEPSLETKEEEKVGEPVVETAGAMRARHRKEANKLIRIRLTCMNPLKTEWPGELFTFGNSMVGTVRKFVPFNADDGWHVPVCIYNMIKNRECQVFYTKKNSRGEKSRVGKLIKEFAVEVLPPLTQEELDDLASVQAAARNLD